MVHLTHHEHPVKKKKNLTQKLAHSWSKQKNKLTLQKKNREEKGKGKAKGKGNFPVRLSCLPLDNRRQRPKKLKAKTDCDVYGRKGHGEYDREHAMSPSSLSSNTQAHAARMTTRLHLSSQPEKVTTFFVLNDCSDDSGVHADVADQNVFLPEEVTGQTLLTPIASTAVDTRTESISDVRAADKDEELWLIEADCKSVGWNPKYVH